MVNVQEGTRRLALLLGAVGAIIGGFASHVALLPILEQRSLHDRFEQLATSDTVKLERITLKTSLPPLPPGVTLNTPEPNPYAAYGGNVVQTPNTEAKATPGATFPVQLDFSRAVPITGTSDHSVTDAVTSRTPSEWHPPIGSIAVKNPNPPQPARPRSFVNKDGISNIDWRQDYEVYSIETQDGQTLYPTPSPSFWSYFSAMILPILGFFAPWVTLRSLGWVVSGFFSTKR